MNQDRFYNGNRVVYSGSLVPALKGKEGTVRSINRRGRVRVMFDGERIATACFPESLTKLRRTPAHIKR